MGQEREWMCAKQILTNNSCEVDHSWEEKAFAEDASGQFGGCVWPPRFYTCSFCRREFRSAQALGGHMNVHRRDRARLKHDHSSVNYKPQSTDDDEVVPHEDHALNSCTSSDALLCSSHDMPSTFLHDIECPKPDQFSDTGPELGSSFYSNPVRVPHHQEEIAGSKKRRIEAKPLTINPKPSRVDRYLSHEPEVFDLQAGLAEDLDLELRLGNVK